ncbi:MAG: DMT family transporter [Bacteroidia bacterium]
MRSELKKAYIELHTAVFIFGFTAIIGKLITSDHFTLVWHRMWVAAIGFFLLPGFYKVLRKTLLIDVFKLFLIGGLVAIHWLTFYGSIKIGNSASLTLGCFGLTSAFTSILEPIIHKKRFVFLDVMLGFLALIGICVIAYFAPQQNEQTGNYGLAILVGIFSSFMAALFSTINSTLTNKIDTKVISFAELSGGFLFLCVIFMFNFEIEGILPFSNFKLIPFTDSPQFFATKYADIIWILILALVCTNIGFVLNLNAMKKVSAFTANLAINLEPVYGIVLAAVLLKEHQNLNIQFYIGTGIILSSVIIHSILANRVKSD